MTSIGDYELVSVLGRGNHGSFHLARPPARLGVDDEHVVLKVLDRSSSNDEFKRFAHEMRVIASARSQYLTPLLDAGQVDGRLFYVVPHHDGGSLNSDAHSPDVAIAVVADAARGAHDLHEIGVVHRDIKPANVFVRNGRGLLADMGLASVGSLATATVGVGPIGSVEFMEPEVVLGDLPGRTSDVWSLAVTLHVALTGVGCHPGLPRESALGALRHVAQHQPTISDRVGEPIAEILHRALGPRRNDRYQTALEFAEDLESIADASGAAQER